MKTFSKRTRELAVKIGNGYCQCSKGCVKPANELHHMFANTKVNQRLYPLFIQSIFNACPINRDCHASKTLPRISENEAIAFEIYLSELIKK